MIGNSKSFAEKTIFAQEKYIKKKERRYTGRHGDESVVLRPTP